MKALPWAGYPRWPFLHLNCDESIRQPMRSRSHHVPLFVVGYIMRGRMLHDALRRPADSIAYTLELFFDVDLSWQCASCELKDKVVQQI